MLAPYPVRFYATLAAEDLDTFTGLLVIASFTETFVVPFGRFTIPSIPYQYSNPDPELIPEINGDVWIGVRLSGAVTAKIPLNGCTADEISSDTLSAPATTIGDATGTAVPVIKETFCPVTRFTTKIRAPKAEFSES